MTEAHCISPKQRYRWNPPKFADITEESQYTPVFEGIHFKWVIQKVICNFVLYFGMLIFCRNKTYIFVLIIFFFLFLFWESFNLWRPLLMIAFYYQTKTSISFWYRQGLNLKSFIQPSETLSVELTGTHLFYLSLCYFVLVSNVEICIILKLLNKY